MRSIRARLLIGLLASVLAVQITTYLLIFARIEDEIDELFDAELERRAYAADSGLALLPIPMPRRPVENPEEGMIILHWDGPASAPNSGSGSLEGVSRATPMGFSKKVVQGREWRLFGAKHGDRLVVAAQPADVRDAAARRISVRTVLPSLMGLPVAAALIWLAVFYGLRPLVKISSALRERSHRDLSPIDPRRLPPDIAPVARALNELMKRLSAGISAQRHFVADAAHELLTPLTAIRLQSQLLARADGPRRRAELMVELQAGVSRTLQLARQLLILARHDSDVDPPHAPLNLSTVVHHVIAVNTPLAEEKAVRIVPRLPDCAPLDGDEEALATLISNLLENAIKYCDPDGMVMMSLGVEPREIRLVVEDSGPGIPPADRERVFDRFYRGKTSAVGGNGLGLAIAREIAARHGAQIVLGDSPSLGGLSACIRFQRPGSSQMASEPALSCAGAATG